MRRSILWLLIAFSAALAVGYGGVFMVRWGLRGLMFGAIFAAILAFAAAAAHGAIAGGGPRAMAALGYGLLAGYAGLYLNGTFKSEFLEYLLVLQLATGIVGLVLCAWRRPDW